MKKFFKLLGLFVCIIFAGACFAACDKAVNVQGTIDIEFENFVSNDDVGSNLWFSCSRGASNNQTETGAHFTYGPEKTKDKSAITIEIGVSKIFQPNLQVREKNNKPFTKKVEIKADNQYNSFIITIPFAEKIDYDFVLSKPSAQINEVQLGLGNSVDLATADKEVRDFLDSTEVWVDNKNVSGTQYTGGFMPILTGEGADKQFGLFGKFINVDMTEDSFMLYLKYGNPSAGSDLPFTRYSLQQLFRVDGEGAISVSIDEVAGQKVYALEYETHDVTASSTLELNDNGLVDLAYISCVVDDVQTRIVNTTDGGDRIDNIKLLFSRVGWKVGNAQAWETGDLPRKTHGQRMTFKYHFEDIDCPTDMKDVLLQSIDFASIKFFINGSAAKNQTYDPNEQAYTFEIGEYDTPETYDGELTTTFYISVDKDSVQLENTERVKDLTLSNQFEFWRGEENIVLSYAKGDDGKQHARIIVANEGAEDQQYLLTITLKDLARFERFTVTFTIGSVTYTKEFVMGEDFLVRRTVEGQLAGAYVLGEQGGQGQHYLDPTGAPADNKISYEVGINGNSQELEFVVKWPVGHTNIEALLSDVQLREVEFEAGGDMYGGSLTQTEMTDYDGTYRTDSSSVEYEINKRYEEANCNIRIEVYSGDVLLYTLMGGATESSNLEVEGYHIYDGGAIFTWYVSAYSSEPDITLQFSTNYLFTLLGGEAYDIETQLLITKIAVTFDEVNA